jgi:modulator of FtsH protease HflC
MQRLIPLFFALMIGVIAIASCVFVVDQRSYAVVFALGEIRQVYDKPGLYVKLPPPFQNVEYYDKRILTIDTADSDRFITSEKLNIMIDSYVKWRIADPKKYYTSVAGNEITASDRIQRSLRAELNNEIGRLTVAQVISGNSGEREQLLDRMRSKINDDAKQIGAEIIDIRFKRVDFAQEVSERVFDRMQTERKRVANERRATGSAESEKIRADADKQREVIVADAYRDSQKMRGEGDGKAAGIYSEAFSQSPEFAAFYRSMEAYRGSFRSRDVMVLDPSSDFFKYLRNPGSSNKGK